MYTHVLACMSASNRMTTLYNLPLFECMQYNVLPLVTIGKANLHSHLKFLADIQQGRYCLSVGFENLRVSKGLV